MTDKHEVVNLFPSHAEAEAAVIDLQKAGFDVQKISIIGKDYQTTEHVRGFLTWKDAAKAGAGEAGYWGSFFGGLFGILTGVGLLFVPGVGPVIVAGHVAGVLAGWLEGMIVGGVGAAVAGGLVGALVGLVQLSHVPFVRFFMSALIRYQFWLMAIVFGVTLIVTIRHPASWLMIKRQVAIEFFSAVAQSLAALLGVLIVFLTVTSQLISQRRLDYWSLD